jgi:protocatechuate 3,4-dioxygenase beta subunit
MTEPHLDHVTVANGTSRTIRRHLLGALAAAGLGAWQSTALGRVLAATDPAPATTPRLTDGPFYPPAFAPNPSPSLIVGTLHPEARPLRLAGRIVDRSGRPVGGSRIEIWQCDAGRHYHHPADGPADRLDKGFLGYGWQAAAADGSYAFETIRPVAYPGRTPHIHVKVKLDGRPVLTSQVFMPDEAGANAADFLWRSLGKGQPLALATFEQAEGRRTAHFDIVVG